MAPRPPWPAVPIYSETMRTSGLALTCLLPLVACSKPETGPPVVHQLAGAATTPLGDLNLLRTKIPAVLLTALQAPYAPPADSTCAGLAAEIQMLDAALGEDLDRPPLGAQADGRRTGLAAGHQGHRGGNRPASLPEGPGPSPGLPTPGRAPSPQVLSYRAIRIQKVVPSGPVSKPTFPCSTVSPKSFMA